MSRFLLVSIVIFNFNYTNSAEGKGGMPQLNPESFSSQLFWLFVFFLILYTIVSSIFIPKIRKIRDGRENTIEKLLSDSKLINESVENAIVKINNDLKKEKEISSIEINKALNENKIILENKISSIDDELEKKRNDMLKDLDKSKKNIQNNIPKIVVSLSDQIFEKILDEKNKSSVQDFEKFTKDYK